MKKVLAVVFLTLMCACIALTATACGGSGETESVDGNTYVYESIEFKGDFEEALKQNMTTMMQATEFSFKDGKMTQKGSYGEASLDYTQDGEKITISGGGEAAASVGDITVKGGKLVLTQTIGAQSVTITFKKK